MTVAEDKALLAIQLLIEGTSVRTVERITQLHREIILRLLVLAGERCIALMDTRMQNMQCKTDSGGQKSGCFVAKKDRNVKVDDPGRVRQRLGVRRNGRANEADSFVLTLASATRLRRMRFLTDLRDRMDAAAPLPNHDRQTDLVFYPQRSRGNLRRGRPISRK